MDPGRRDQRIQFQRGTPTSDDYGGQTVSWASIADAWAQVRWGTGQERRAAAQEGSEQAATFVCDPSSTLQDVKVTDRVSYRGEAWDITSVAPMSRSEIHFTAVRSS